ELAWLHAAPAPMGRFVALRFEGGDGALRGISLSRIYDDGALRAGRSVHLWARGPRSEHYGWMTRETLRMLSGAGAQWVTARSSCPHVGVALRQAGFHAVSTCAAFWRHRSVEPPDGPLHLGWGTNDEALLPYPA